MNIALGTVGLMELPEEMRPPKNIMHHRDRVKEWLDQSRRQASQPPIPHDPAINTSEAEEFRKRMGLPPVR